MPHYTAPLRDMQFVLFDLLQAEAELAALPRHAGLDRETIEAVLEEGAKFASQVIQPLNQVGDREGCTWHGDGVVTAPPGFKEAYRQYVDNGWPSVSCDPDWGGQGLPTLVNNRLYEMWNSANQAWLMYAGLSHSAYECLMAFGTEQQKQVYLTKIVSGEWTGTMCLTEPHCGTDLGLLKTKAEPNDDGSFALTGTKIFISAGEHDLAENILHLVLARLPGAPAGTKGISLFLVPKFLPDANGAVGARNTIKAGSIEHKMGIHGNATCVMNLDGATGWLIGEANKGLAAMFVMMNSARLGVGMQSLGQAEVAYQNAAAYAKDRLQGRAATGPASPDKPADSILVHPDVRRMLLTARACNEGGRALATWTALLLDREHDHPDPAVREEASELMALLTPVVKAFLTDNGWETATLCQQVLGGHGYISEWGMDQYVRDARINMIYEGTNGIQALDLLGRKVLMDGGQKFGRFAALVQAFLKENAGRPELAEFTAPLAKLLADTVALTQEIGAKAKADPNEVGAAAVPYLRITGHLCFAWLWARMAALAIGKDDDFHTAKVATARFYFAWLLPEVEQRFREARAGAPSLMAMPADAF
ncbi:MAG: acyl-CoA dehydrogenase C-terminal domain-containing protein [Pseudomonadota bacterium]